MVADPGGFRGANWAVGSAAEEWLDVGGEGIGVEEAVILAADAALAVEQEGDGAGGRECCGLRGIEGAVEDGKPDDGELLGAAVKDEADESIGGESLGERVEGGGLLVTGGATGGPDREGDQAAAEIGEGAGSGLTGDVEGDVERRAGLV